MIQVSVTPPAKRKTEATIPATINLVRSCSSLTIYHSDIAFLQTVVDISVYTKKARRTAG
ncbi:MAG: hypothetical protein BWY61_01719 [Firmicutes bacterium ADurb.Bin354]|nr:MAG: hypothetical protein BWY61_01719 [Firmicutes bacterium ADurb.Bin354]